MRTKIIEATNNELNWGKFMLGAFDGEWSARSSISESNQPLLSQLGWCWLHVWVFDLQTGEGALFYPKGDATTDLNKHRIWVCPLFEPFLTWLYEQDLEDLDKLPAKVDLPNAPFALRGYRRSGE